MGSEFADDASYNAMFDCVVVLDFVVFGQADNLKCATISIACPVELSLLVDLLVQHLSWPSYPVGTQVYLSDIQSEIVYAREGQPMGGLSGGPAWVSVVGKRLGDECWQQQ